MHNANVKSSESRSRLTVIGPISYIIMKYC